MTPRRLASLCFRLLAILVLMDMLSDLNQSLQFVGFLVSQISAGAFGLASVVQALLMIIAPGLQLVFAIWLWRRSGVAAAWLFGYDLQDDPDEPDQITGVPTEGLTPALAEAIAFSVLGAWVLCDAIPESVRMLGATVLFSGSMPAGYKDQITGTTMAFSLAIGIRLALGFWLLFGAHGIVRMLRKLRGIGLEDQD